MLAHFAGVPVEEVLLPLLSGFGLLGATVRTVTMRGRRRGDAISSSQSDGRAGASCRSVLTTP
jgi:hypothetical protein